MSDTEHDGVTFACEDCGSRVEDAPMRPATCVECGGAFEVVTDDVDVDLPLLLRSVDRGDEVRLRKEDGSFVRGDVRRIWHEADEDEVRLTLSGDGQASYEVRADAGDKLATVTVTKVMGSGESAVRAGRDRVVGVLNLADHPDALDDHRGKRVVLVGCGQKKASHPVPARQLYESAYFDKKHGYAEQDDVDAWFILSAEYGFVHPDERIEPYDTHIDDVDADEWCHLVQEQMPHLDGSTVEVLAGEAYFKALDLALDFAVGTDGAVERPLEGLGIGEQMAWLKEHTGDDTTEESAEVSDESSENEPAELTEEDFPAIEALDAHGDPVHCGTCKRDLPGDPVLEFECPSCGAEKGEKCSRPSGHSGNFVHPHGDRDRLALAKGITPPCPEGMDPMTPEEAAEALGIECEVDETDPFDYEWPWFVDGVLDAENAITTGEIDMAGGRAHHIAADGRGAEAAEEPETTLVNMGSTGREGVTPIDRSTQFGNPFRLEKDGGDYTREGSIEAYRVWFAEQLEDDEFREAVEDLRGETIGCWCKPKACHGDVIVEYLREGEIDVPETAPADPRPTEDTTEQATLAPEEDDGLQEDESDDDLDGCVALVRTTGEPCGNSVTTEASDTSALLCGTHAKASSVSRADAAEGEPDPDLRDRLVEAGMNGSHAYYLATLTDSAEMLWHIVTDCSEIGGREVTYEPTTLATLAPTVARLDDVDAEGHPLAYDGCVAVIDVGARGKDYRCGSGGYANKLLCGTHQDTKPENLRTVFDADAPEDLRIDEWPEIGIGDDRFLAVEQRDGDLLAISIPEYEYRRIEGFGYLVDELEDAGDVREDDGGNQSLTDDGAGDVQEPGSEEIETEAGADESVDAEERDRLEQYLRDNYATHIGTDGGTQILMETFDTVEEFEAATFEEKLRAAGVRAPALNVILDEYDSVVDLQYRAGGSPALTKHDGVGQDSAHVVGKCFLKWSSMGGAPPRAWNGIHSESPEIAPEDDGAEEPVDRQSAREQVLDELVPLLEADLSPSQALDYWATEATEATHGAFTQQEWAEIRDVSRQAIGGNAGKARDALKDPK
jgi:predicted RNA-binding Zn-ribbon protein involved in translation (DUF1610 family)